MRSARQRLSRRPYSRARAQSASKPLLRARSSQLSPRRHPPHFPRLLPWHSLRRPRLWLRKLPTADTKGLATSHEAPQTYGRVIPVATSGMIIQLFGGLNPAELTRGLWRFRVVVRRA